MDLLCTDSMSILVIVSDYLSSTAYTVKLEGRSHEISASVLPRREESGLHVQERARCHYGRDHVVLRGAEEERSPPRRGGTGTHPDSHECESPKREVVRDRWSLCRNEGAARRVLPDQCPRLERGDPGGFEVSIGAVRNHGSASGQRFSRQQPRNDIVRGF